MNFKAGESLINKPINFVFIGSCTNSRIEDFRVAASYVKGKKKASNVTAWLVPGSKKVEAQIVNEGLKDIFTEAGFEIRQPGCSACLAMNEDKIPQGEYCVSTSNRILKVDKDQVLEPYLLVLLLLLQLPLREK